MRLEKTVSQLAPPPPPTSIPQAFVDAPSAEALCRQLNSTGVLGLEELQRAVRSAWEVAQRQQEEEITSLSSKVKLAQALSIDESAEEDLGLSEKAARAALFSEEEQRTRNLEQSVDSLWKLSENRSWDSLAERQARAQALTRLSFAFLRGLVEGDGDEANMVPVPGEGLVALPGSKARLRSLKRHAAAGLVEYRLFAEALAREEGLGEALMLDGLVDEESAMTAVQTLFSRFLFKSNRDSYREIMAELQENDEEGAQVFKQAAEGTTDTPLERWLQLLADILSKSQNFLTQSEEEMGNEMELAFDAEEDGSVDQVFTFIAGLFSPVAFPALLMSVCARQGCFEAIPLYTTSRMLAALNLQALARHEGFDAPLEPHKAVAESEGALMLSHVKEVLSNFGSALVLGWLLALVFAVVAVWNIVSIGAGLLFSTGSVDPLDF